MLLKRRETGAGFFGIPGALLFVLVLSGCVSTAPRPSTGAVDVLTAKTVDAFYATDRARSTRYDDERFYGHRRGVLVFGLADVDVPVAGPADSKSGALPRFGNVRIRDAVVRGAHEMLPDAFAARLRERVATSPRRELLLFIHGYNTSFDAALRRTAQLAWETRFTGPAMLFSWPSKKAVTGYTADEASVEWATTHLRQVLEFVLLESGAERVALVAHSMGSRALTRALLRIERERGTVNSIRHIVLAAPDIDADIFIRDIAPELVDEGRTVTLYASSRDRALELSEQLHDYPRAGDAGTAPVVVSGVDTIDATAVDTSFLGHNYYGENVSIVTDLRALLRDDRAPDQRPRMNQIQTESGRYWRLLAPAP